VWRLHGFLLWVDITEEPRKRPSKPTRKNLETIRVCLAADETSEPAPIRLRVLGGLEAEAGERALVLGGPRQRAVLAALLLRAGEVVPDGRLIDDVWGESPPASAGHSLESYVSKLRQALVPHGIALERRGAGYRIDLGPATLDSIDFAALVEAASQASAAGDHGGAAKIAKDALGLWRGPVLSDIPLGPDARAEAERLTELRWRAFEIRNDAGLALGSHAEIVGELRRLTEESPYREGPVAQLMLALYRSGRQAEALDVYERIRRRLDEDLGLQPSPELQRLAGRIVRQDPDLQLPSPPAEPSLTEPERPRRRAPRGRVLAAVGAAVTAAIVVALTLVLWPEAPASGSGTRVALIRMWNPGTPGGEDEQGWGPFVDGLQAAARKHRLTTEIVDLFPRRPPQGGYAVGSSQDVERLSARLKAGNFDLVLWPLGLTGPPFWDVVKRYPHTRFVFLDYCCAKGAELGGAPNVTAITLHAEQAAHLAGYLSGLMEAQRSVAGRRGHIVSIVVGETNFPQENVWVRGFSAGARRALPGVEVLVDSSYDYDHQNVCEKIANRQIDAGSGVVFAAAGDCGLGALRAAGLRGVWAIAANEDRSHLGPHILASATKRFDRLTELSVDWFLEGRLPPGGDVKLGLRDDAVALVDISPDVPREIRRKLAQEAARLQASGTA
jgi:DNA-binding SARP family transcriptional activator/basic membrane lipoprotein Med (substrate-binding protein (PBP1-ABC) superfamily)